MNLAELLICHFLIPAAFPLNHLLRSPDRTHSLATPSGKCLHTYQISASSKFSIVQLTTPKCCLDLIKEEKVAITQYKMQANDQLPCDWFLLHLGCQGCAQSHTPQFHLLQALCCTLCLISRMASVLCDRRSVSHRAASCRIWMDSFIAGSGDDAIIASPLRLPICHTSID